VSRSEKTKLKQIVRSLILAQGNVFIKELLRSKQKAGAEVTIGSTKAEFERNLATAIDDNILAAEDIEDWLALTEGWGAQHIYLFRASGLQKLASLKASIAASKHKALLTPSKLVVFPAKLKLTSIVVDDEKLALTWHRGSTRFSRAKGKDTELLEGLDRYELRAYLEHRDRAVVRFEWLFDREYCGLFVQLAFNDPAHDAVIKELWKVLISIGVAKGPSNPVPLVQAVRELGSIANSVERSSKWRTSGGYVDIYADADGGIAAVGPVARARKGIKVEEFSSADGQFELPTLEPVPGEAKRLRLSVYGGEGRIRISSQCLRKQVYNLVEEIWRQNA
jgi:hypothetical protein